MNKETDDGWDGQEFPVLYRTLSLSGPLSREILPLVAILVVVIFYTVVSAVEVVVTGKCQGF